MPGSNLIDTNADGELPTMRLTVYERHERREEISTLQRIGALRESGFPLIVEHLSAHMDKKGVNALFAVPPKA